MNLMQTMSSPMMTLMTLMMLPNLNKTMLYNMSKTSIMFILMQTMHLHTKSTQQHTQMTLLLTSHTNVNNMKIKTHNFCLDTMTTPLLMLTTILMMTCILMSEKTMYHTHKSLLICLFSAMMTLFLTFTTSNMILFYIMFESSMMPLMMMIGLWGSRKEKTRATYYFLLYTMIGSLPLFLTMLTMQNYTSTFNNTTLQHTHIPPHTQMMLFFGLFLAFAMKTPLIPWHSWLPLAHVEAPGMGSILLAGMLLKLGTYGFMRFTIPMLPHTSKYIAPMMITISMMSMWLASMNSLRQNDMKRMMAYSSMAHMGMMTAACFSTNPMSMKGAMMLMISHGLTSSALFALVSFLYERHKSRLMKNFQGSSYTTPMLSSLMFMTALAHMSTPGSMNFMGEYLCLLGLWELHPSMTMISTMGMFMTTTYLLLLYIQISSSKPSLYNTHKMQDLSSNETKAMMLLTMPNMTMGLFPYPMLKWNTMTNLKQMMSLLCMNMMMTSLMMATTTSSMFSAMWLMMTYMNAALMLMMLEMEFMAILMIMVYMGAMAILFLFTMMMLNLNTSTHTQEHTHLLPLSMMMMLALSTQTMKPQNNTKSEHTLKMKNDYNLETMSKLMYSEYSSWFLMSSMMLLMSMMASMNMMQKEDSSNLKQELNKQLQRNMQHTQQLKLP